MEALKCSLEDLDPEVMGLIRKEKQRQLAHLELVASENFTSRAVLECLSSSFHNRYCEGYPGKRYYSGQEFADQLELLCQERALKAFRLDAQRWGVNVQPYSGSPANFAVFTAVVGPKGRIMGLDLPDGGHLTHGFQTPTKKISATSLYFESRPYFVDRETGIIDYERLREIALEFRPDVIIAGTSCYPRNLDYMRFREICDECGCYLMADMAHVSGLVAAGVLNDPFEHCDIVTTTTHKSLRGPRSGLIFYRKGMRKMNSEGKEEPYNLETPINEAIFPGLQGGPHMHQVAGVAVALEQACTAEFKEYVIQVVDNAKALGDEMLKLGYTLATGGTDCHLILVDFRPQGITGAVVDTLLEAVSVTANRNACVGDKSALSPSGVRFGSPALTSRGFKVEDFRKVAHFLHRGVCLALEIRTASPTKKLKDFKLTMRQETFQSKIRSLKEEIETFALSFDMPGIDY